MSTNLYILNGDTVQPMSEEPYENEEYLQNLIASNPQLLLSDQQQEHGKLFLIQREFPIPDAGNSSNLFALDHLFINQDGVPVFVEVKRSSDTRIRREVVAQMLDYACQARLLDTALLREAFPPDVPEATSDDFWERVDANLKAEHLCLVFAADRIPDSLREIIAFINRAMPNIEAYGVEIHQFLSGETVMLSSTVIGAKTAVAKKQPLSYEWTADRIAAAVLSSLGKNACKAFRNIVDIVQSLDLSCSYGRGSKNGNLIVKYKSTTLFYFCVTDRSAYIEVGIRTLAEQLGAKWSEQDIRKLFWAMTDKTDNRIRDTSQYLYIDISLMTDSNSLSAFQQILIDLKSSVQ